MNVATSVTSQAVKPQTVTSLKPVAATHAPKSINDILAETTSQTTLQTTSLATAQDKSTYVKVGTVIQLASVSVPAAGAAMEKTLQTKYNELLGGANLRVVKADLGSKGIFYRIQSQPVSSDLAGQICQALKNRNAGCLIVRH